jgi:D-alanyl-D-alanine dipeptidase
MRLLFFCLVTGWLGGLTSCRQTAMPDPLRLEPVHRPTVVAAALVRGLVRVDYFDRTIAVQLPYATADNVFRRVLYPPGFPALVSQPTALKLAVANSKLRRRGLRLLVLDAYRPPEVQWQLFDHFGSDRYVSNPRKRWSKHTYGRAVDVTLIGREGRPLRMPSVFDDFSEKSAAAYRGNDPVVRANVGALQEAMTAAGFSMYADEWWHFNDLSDSTVFDHPPVFGREIGLPTGRDPGGE